jgi:hypothetical protein
MAKKLKLPGQVIPGNPGKALRPAIYKNLHPIKGK